MIVPYTGIRGQSRVVVYEARDHGVSETAQRIAEKYDMNVITVINRGLKSVVFKPRYFPNIGIRDLLTVLNGLEETYYVSPKKSCNPNQTFNVYEKKGNVDHCIGRFNPKQGFIEINANVPPSDESFFLWMSQLFQLDPKEYEKVLYIDSTRK
ncbi:MAG: hypothetical protein HYW24_02575 [Candidatus Aenigmarchaeota archaeon]|nr:hypothetical protein [Candidatus Aenigmarchaeota archaeon]